MSQTLAEKLRGRLVYLFAWAMLVAFSWPVLLLGLCVFGWYFWETEHRHLSFRQLAMPAVLLACGVFQMAWLYWQQRREDRRIDKLAEELLARPGMTPRTFTLMTGRPPPPCLDHMSDEAMKARAMRAYAASLQPDGDGS